MIAKIIHGAAFGGVVNYVNDPRKNARLVSFGDGINISDNRTITDSFVMQSQMSGRCTKPVCHIILSFSKHDSNKLTDDFLDHAVKSFLNDMGYDDNQFVAFRNYDREHPHVHIIVNRVNNKGKVTKDSHERDRSVKICRDFTLRHGLYIAKGKEAVKENRLRNMDYIKYLMFHGVKESLEISNNWKQFQEELSKFGMRFSSRYNPKTQGIEGISFSIDHNKVGHHMKHDVSFSGKQLDESLTLSHICEKLGNPVSIVHEQAHDMYEDAKADWYDTHNGFEVSRIDEVFPDFDRRFPRLSQMTNEPTPDMAGLFNDDTIDAIRDILEAAEEITDIGNHAVHIGLATLGEILFQPYAPAISTGGGGSSASKLGWGDDDKYKRKHKNGIRRGGVHR